MPVRPVSPEVLVTELAEWIAATRPTEWLRIVLDGAPPARPDELADALVEPLKVRGRAVLRVSAADFLRPASLRYERGRTDPDAFYTDWLDLAGLTREVLAPLQPGGTGRVLPSLWDAASDRATRADYTQLPEGGVLLLDGALLLGRGLPAELTVHLWLSPAALARKLPSAQQWALAGYARYEQEATPAETADLVVRVDNAEHPAILRDNRV
ncbi:MAG TPA: uridine kinase [Pseudonocardiaceae bacterium]|nr:uridine kinase [Pseudonocardiaceae bacterium]